MIGLDLPFRIDIFKLVPSRPALRAYVDRCSPARAPARQGDRSRRRLNRHGVTKKRLQM